MNSIEEEVIQQTSLRGIKTRHDSQNSYNSGKQTPNGGNITTSSLGSVSISSGNEEEEHDSVISHSEKDCSDAEVDQKYNIENDGKKISKQQQSKKVNKDTVEEIDNNTTKSNNKNNHSSNRSVSSKSSSKSGKSKSSSSKRSKVENFKRNNHQNKITNKKVLTQEERELFMRIEQEWREEDAWIQEKPGSLSTLLWTPILIGLRCFNIWLSVVTWPLKIFCQIALGWKIQTISFWDVPLEKRKQTITVGLFVLMLPCVALFYLWSLVLIIFPLTTFPMLLYYFFIFYIDKSPENGQRRPFMRYWKLWRHFANYFPLRLIRTQPLDPNRKYVFAYHPHGIISMGAFGNFATDATGFSRKFPGIDLRLLTLEMNFWCPWLREILLSMGVCSASKKSCNKILSKGPGSSIMLVVGGAAESLDTQPGTYRLTLDRKGFVRVALDNEADLIPVLGFGENDVFDTMYYPPNTWARNLQEKIRKSLGFAIPIFKGVGFFNLNFGILPHRKPIIVVVGKPIKLPKLPEHLKGSALSTTPEGRAIVDKYHQIYIENLRAIWEMYKNRWAVHRAGSLLLKTKDGLRRPSSFPPSQ